ncbi:MAG TPA: TolC family protein [Planctomycetota bacterium]|nr:TolC family protein [Planctomycetota bacterium]
MSPSAWARLAALVPLMAACHGPGVARPEPRVVTAATAMPADDFAVAVAQAPEVAAARARRSAARSRASAAGSLPHPRLSVEGMRTPRRDHDGVDLALEQELPRWGERRAARDRAGAEALLASADVRAVRARVAADAYRAIATADARDRAADVVAGQAARVDALIAARLAAAALPDGADAGEIVALRGRRDLLAIEHDDLRRMADDARDDARAALGTGRDAVLPTPPALVLTGARPEHHPDLATAGARAAIAAAEADMARAEHRPGLSVGVGWEREDLANADEDEYRVMLGISVPIDQRPARAHADAARAEREAALRDGDAARARAAATYARAQRAVAQAEATRARIDAVVQRLEAAVAASRADAAAGRGAGVRDVFARLDELSDARRRALDAELALAEAAADLIPLLSEPGERP